MSICRNNTIISYTAAVIALIAAIALGFAMAPWGFNFSDEPYQMLNAMDWRNTPMAPLTAWLSNRFGVVNDWSWLAFKRLAWGLNVVAILIGGAWYFCHTSRKSSAVWVTALAVAGAALVGVWERMFGWDNYSNVMAALTIVCWLWWYNRPGWLKAFILGLVIGIGALMRMPSLVAWALAIVMMAVDGKIRLSKRWSSIAVLTAACFATMLAGICAFYGSPTEWMAVIHANHYGAHSTTQILMPLKQSIIMSVVLGTCIWAVYYAMRRYALQPHITVALILGVALCVYGALRWNVLNSVPAIAMLLPLFILPAFKDKSLRTPICAVLLLAATPAAGSVLGLKKFLVWAILPIMWMWCRPYIDRNVRLTMLAIIPAWFFASAKINAHAQGGYAIDGVLCHTHQLTGPKVSGIQASAYPAFMAESVEKEFRPYSVSGWHTRVVGGDPSRFFYQYLFERLNEWDRHGWGYVNGNERPEHVAAMESDILSHSSEPIAVLYLPSIGMNEHLTMSPMETMLASHLTLTVDYPHFKIYTSQP